MYGVVVARLGAADGQRGEFQLSRLMTGGGVMIKLLYLFPAQADQIYLFVSLQRVEPFTTKHQLIMILIMVMHDHDRDQDHGHDRGYDHDLGS